MPRPGIAGTARVNVAARAAATAVSIADWYERRSRRFGKKPGRGRAEHETRHEVAVAAPQQLRDRAAHRVADRDHGPGAELDQRRRAVVGAVGEPEDPARADALPVTAQVGRDHAEAFAERLERLEPVQARRSRTSRGGAAGWARLPGPAARG